MNQTEPVNLDIPPSFLMNAEQHPKTSPVARPRTERGDRIPTNSAYAIPGAGREPLDNSKYPQLIEQIQPHFPASAAKLMHDYSDKLIPAARDVDKAYNLAFEELELRQRESDEREALYLEQADKIERQLELAVGPLLAPREVVVAKISAARLEVAEACGKVGVTAHDGIEEHEVLAVAPMSAEKAAEVLRVPSNVPGQSTAGKLLSGAGTVLIGTISGVSAGLAAGILDAKSLEYQVGKLAAAAAAGVVFSAFARYGLLSIFKTAAEAKYTDRPTREVIGKMVQAYLVALAAAAMYTTMERQGLLKLADAANAVGQLSGIQVAHVPAYVLYVMAALISFGYVVFSSVQGYREGRDSQTPARVQALIAEDARLAVQRRRSDPLVGDALAKVARLRHFLQELDEHDALISRVEAPFMRRLQEAAAMRLPRPTEISERNQKLIQDAIDQYQGTQLEIDLVLLDLIAKIENREGFFKRLFYAIFPRRRATKRRTFKAEA